MITIFRWILIVASIFAIHPAAVAQSAAPPDAPADWPVTSAPARFIIEPNDASPTTPISSVRLFLPDPRWTTIPIRVYTDTGTAVSSDLLWAVPGEPVTLLFDSSLGAKHYEVYLGSANWPAMHLTNTKAGVWLETREGDGKLVDKLPDMIAAFNGSQKVLGRALLNGIDEGGNRFGVQGKLFLHFQGFFDVAAQEHLDFGIYSADAAFVAIDNKEVVKWPGQHDWGPAGGPNGPPQGGIDLAPGSHVMDVYNDHIDGYPPMVMCAVAMKGGPFEKWGMLDSNNSFFRRIGYAHVTRYEAQSDSSGVAPKGVPAIAIDYGNTGGQSLIDTDTPDLGLIGLQLKALFPASLNTVNWTFDDGTTATGQSVSHLFPRPGPRTVQVALKDGSNNVVASFSQVINVHPDWTNPGNQPDMQGDHLTDIMKRDLSAMPGPDLSSCFTIFGFYDQQDALLKLLPFLCAKMKDVGENDLPALYGEGVMALLREDHIHKPEQTKLMQAISDRAAAVTNPAPAMVTAISKIHLSLGYLLLETTADPKQLTDLVASIKRDSLDGNWQRSLVMLQGDMALAVGDSAGAKKIYESQAPQMMESDARSSIHQTAKLSVVRGYIDKKDLESAEDTLNGLSWENLSVKLSANWQLTRLRLYQAENMQLAAYIWAKRIMPLIKDEGRTEFLFRTTEIAFAQGDNDLGNKCLIELLKQHPYSPEAAQAKQKWPGKP